MFDYKKIKYYRELNNMTVSSLAKKLKRSKKVMEELESGEKEIDLNIALELANIFNIKVDDLKRKISINYYISLILFVIGVISCIVIGNMYLLLIVPFSLANIYTLYMILKNKYTISLDDNVPKSILNFKLTDNRKERLSIYLLECNILSSIYIAFDTICELFNIKIFIFNLKILKDANVNKFVIFILTYLLLFVLSFIIELVFGENMMTKNKKGE